MHQIHYSKSSMFNQAFGCVFITAGCIWALMHFQNWHVRLVCGLLAVSLPVLSIALFRRLLGSSVAFAYDSKNLLVTSLFSAALIPWQNVQSISRETMQRSSMFGLVKQDIAKEIAITFNDNGRIRKLKVNESLLDASGDEIIGLVANMARYGNMATQNPSGANGPLAALLRADGTTTKSSATFGRRI